MTFPRTRKSSFPNAKAKILYETEAVLHLTPTRWFLLLFGCVLPEISGAVVVYKISPALSALLFAAALSTLAFILTFLRRQQCFIRILKESIELETRRNRTSMKRKDIHECALIKSRGVVLKHRDEIQMIELQDPKAFHAAFQKMVY